MLDNKKYSMFCFSEDLRNCSKITYTILSTYIQKQQPRSRLGISQ